MLLVISATLPGLAVLTFFFGYGHLIQVALALLAALVAESLVLWLRNKVVWPYLCDYSALLTGLLLGLSLPPLAPWWLALIGAFFAIVIAKQLYGGLGQNPFNPAMIGYVVLLISFPLQMTSWLPPSSLQVVSLNFADSAQLIFTGISSEGLTMPQLQQSFDTLSQATPLDTLKTAVHSVPQALIVQQPLFKGVIAGLGWQWVNVAFLAGGLLLLSVKVIHWHIPLSFLASLFCCAAGSWLYEPLYFPSPLLHLFSGATMLGAFFIATDPVSAATTPRGRLIFGALIGALVWLMRSWSGYPDGVAFAVLLANITVPLIDHYTQPPVYGHG